MYTAIILGAGLYGLYSALYCAKKLRAGTGEKILVIEPEDAAFKRATYINQARVHMGYHYPRSLYTASKSANYFHRFVEDYAFCINTKFDQVYATSANFSWTNAAEFKKFCEDARIKCQEIDVNRYFNDGMCDGAFLTEEYTYDACILRDYFIGQLSQYPSVEIRYSTEINAIEENSGSFVLETTAGTFRTEFLLNATYAAVNDVVSMLGYTPLKIKYELCEIILCNTADCLKNVGLTVMDGPFFSIMPFGKTGLHSLTSVTFTPHETSYDLLPKFKCQEKADALCKMDKYILGNCNACPGKPETAWPYMSNLARKYMKEMYSFSYEQSLFSMKPILKSSEIDDSRPTVIKVLKESPAFVSVLSGKINTVYDLDEVLDRVFR